jgi:hypothetical protein
MALSADTLRDEFLKIFDPNNADFVGWPTTVAEAITNWTNAYDTYALDAEDHSGDSLLIGNTVGFSAALTAVWKDIPPGPAGTETTAANALDTAFVAYWTVIPPALTNFGLINLLPGWGTELSSLSVAAPGFLATALLTEFNKKTEDMTTLATNIANAFHTVTTTNIVVTILGTDPSGLVPMSDISTVF